MLLPTAIKCCIWSEFSCDLIPVSGMSTMTWAQLYSLQELWWLQTTDEWDGRGEECLYLNKCDKNREMKTALIRVCWDKARALAYLISATTETKTLTNCGGQWLPAERGKWEDNTLNGKDAATCSQGGQGSQPSPCELRQWEWQLRRW